MNAMKELIEAAEALLAEFKDSDRRWWNGEDAELRLEVAMAAAKAQPSNTVRVWVQAGQAGGLDIDDNPEHGDYLWLTPACIEKLGLPIPDDDEKHEVEITTTRIEE